ncbi:hypothetical protein JXA85_06475 [Candidatus Woesearchaeota archaeon]|nr:hypothetical protein [Candidatus Woesearchaeota archaeon]
MTLFVGTHEVKYNGPINLKNFYRELHDWVIENEFVPSRKNNDFPEILFYESRSQPGGGEMWVWWRPIKVPQGNSFYRYVLRISFHLFKMKDQEIMHGNKKYKFKYAENKIIITGILETDYQKKWRKHPLLKQFYPFFLKRIAWHTVEQHKKILQDYCHDLQKTIKAYYGKPHWESTEPSFRPKWGIWEDKPVGP